VRHDNAGMIPVLKRGQMVFINHAKLCPSELRSERKWIHQEDHDEDFSVDGFSTFLAKPLWQALQSLILG